VGGSASCPGDLSITLTQIPPRQKKVTGTEKAPWRNGRVPPAARLDWGQGRGGGWRGWCPSAPPARGQRGGTASGAGSCATRVFSYCSWGRGFSSAGASRQRGRHPLCRLAPASGPPGGMGRCSQVGAAPISPQAGPGAGDLLAANQPESSVKHPPRHWGTEGCGTGLGCCCKEQEPPWQG